MMKSFIGIYSTLKLLSAFVFTLFVFQQQIEGGQSKVKEKPIITATKRIYLPKFPGAYNPAIIKFNDGYLMFFRYLPNRYEYWISYIGVVQLDESFDPISDGELLDTRWATKGPHSQSEDARVFMHKGKLYLVYNDNMELENPSVWERRDMYLTEVIYEDGLFSLGVPLKLVYEAKYRQGPWQKNWSPFIWNETLLFSYTISSHEVVIPDMLTGFCEQCYETKKSFHWPLGELRGGTPAHLVDGEYLAFFHSGVYMSSTASGNQPMWHYYMGAYAFSAQPPFEMTKISQSPLDSPGFYTYSSYSKRVIYPTGLVREGNHLYVSYGKDDCEMWIATIDLAELKKSMVKVD